MRSQSPVPSFAMLNDTHTPSSIATTILNLPCTPHAGPPPNHTLSSPTHSYTLNPY